MYLDGGMGGGGWLLTSFFSIIYILGLVCYKHTIHAYGKNPDTKKMQMRHAYGKNPEPIQIQETCIW